jgi:NAD(P)-dependent dehydrogenase (short-subunit alcohol dehydrogenase family)
MIECGPGKVLAGMVKRIDPTAHGCTMFDPATLAEARGLVMNAAREAGRAGHRRVARHRPRHRAGTWRPGLKVVGTATSEAGAAAHHRRRWRAPGGRASASTSPTAALDAAIDAIVKQHGGLHVLVNNAGITRDTLAMRMKDEDWDAVLDTNLKAVFRACRAAMRR